MNNLEENQPCHPFSLDIVYEETAEETVKHLITLSSVRYYTNDKAKCSDDVSFIGKDKYPKKMLMWIAIFNRSTSKLK